MTMGWQDFPVGRAVVTQAVTITESHVVQFAALTGDWYPLHMNAEAAGAGPFGERIGHGSLTFAMAVGLMAQTQCYGDCVLAWLGADQMRATKPVRFGDTIHVQAIVTESRPAKNGERGVVSLDYLVRNQRDEAVMKFTFTLLMRSRS
jgi:acyl dehydratase